jgi:hypothetical protein
MKRRPRRVAQRARLIGWNKSKEGKPRYSRASSSASAARAFPFDRKNPVIAETWRSISRDKATTETERAKRREANQEHARAVRHMPSAAYGHDSEPSALLEARGGGVIGLAENTFFPFPSHNVWA